MNWTGGNLHRQTRNGTNRPSTLIQRQKQHFSNVRAQQRSLQGNFPPPRPSFFQEQAERDDDFMPLRRNKRARQSSLEEYENVAPVARRLRAMTERSCNSDVLRRRELQDHGPGNSEVLAKEWPSDFRSRFWSDSQEPRSALMDLNQSRHARRHFRADPNVSADENQGDSVNDKLEQKRRKLLAQQDWLGIEQPLLQLNPPSSTRSECNNYGITQPQRVKSPVFQKDILATSRHFAENEHIRVRIGADTFSSEFSGSQSRPAAQSVRSNRRSAQNPSNGIGQPHLQSSKDNKITQRMRIAGTKNFMNTNDGYDGNYWMTNAIQYDLKGSENDNPRVTEADTNDGMILPPPAVHVEHGIENIESENNLGCMDAVSSLETLSSEACSNACVIGSIAEDHDAEVAEKNQNGLQETERKMRDFEKLWKTLVCGSENDSRNGSGSPCNDFGHSIEAARARDLQNQGADSLQTDLCTTPTAEDSDNCLAEKEMPVKVTSNILPEEESNEVWKDFIVGESCTSTESQEVLSSSNALPSSMQVLLSDKPDSKNASPNSTNTLDNGPAATKVHATQEADDAMSQSNNSSASDSTFPFDRPSSVANASVAPAVLYDKSRPPRISRIPALQHFYSSPTQQSRFVFRRPRPFVGAQGDVSEGGEDIDDV